MTERIPHNPDASPTHLGNKFRPEAAKLGKTIARFEGAFPGNTSHDDVGEEKEPASEPEPSLAHKAGRGAAAIKNWNAKNEGEK